MSAVTAPRNHFIAVPNDTAVSECRNRRFFDGRKEKRRCFWAPPLSLSQAEQVLAERVRDVVERRVQLVADTLHRADGGNGNERSDQAIFNGRRAFFVLQQLQHLRHLWSPKKIARDDHTPAQPGPGVGSENLRSVGLESANFHRGDMNFR